MESHFAGDDGCVFCYRVVTRRGAEWMLSFSSQNDEYEEHVSEEHTASIFTY
jgi:hypothetical protein